ncbi:MAG: PilW family protein [Myxococcota bacterium]|nr:PilW family protein [Myxococcota bacterium]
MRRRVKSSARGMTLVELLSAMVIGSLLMSTIAYSFSLQQRFYNRKLDYTEALQNARVSLDVMRDYLRQAGFGFRPHRNATGVFGVGMCFADNGDHSFDCNNVDAGSDRLRLFMGLPDGYLRSKAGDGPAVDSIPIASTTGWTLDPYAARPEIGQPQISLSKRMVMISGTCDQTSGTSVRGTDVVMASVDAPGVNGHHHNHQFSQVGGSTNFDGCPYGYTDYSVGPAQFVDFYIDRSNKDHPTLKMYVVRDSDSASRTRDASALTIAEDIETLQFEYGIDVDGKTGIATKWCDDPADVTGECATGLSRSKNLARIVAVNVAIVARTRQSRRGLSGMELPVQDYTPPAVVDGYNRFVFRATIAMRNNRL